MTTKERREAENLRELVKDADDFLDDPGIKGKFPRQEIEARSLRRMALDQLNKLERKAQGGQGENDAKGDHDELPTH